MRTEQAELRSTGQPRACFPHKSYLQFPLFELLAEGSQLLLHFREFLVLKAGYFFFQRLSDSFPGWGARSGVASRSARPTSTAGASPENRCM